MQKPVRAPTAAAPAVKTADAPSTASRHDDISLAARSAAPRDALVDLTISELQQVHLASAAHAASWQLANALLESTFRAAEDQAVQQLHVLATCVELAHRAAVNARARAAAEVGRRLLQSALCVQVCV